MGEIVSQHLNRDSGFPQKHILSQVFTIPQVHPAKRDVTSVTEAGNNTTRQKGTTDVCSAQNPILKGSRQSGACLLPGEGKTTTKAVQ